MRKTFTIIGNIVGFIALFGIGVYFLGVETMTGGCVNASSPVKDLRRSDRQIQNEAYDTVVEGQDRYVPALIESMGNLDSESEIVGAAMAESALADIGKPAVEPLIEALEGSDDFAIRAGAANVLGMINDPIAVEPLIIGLKDSDEQVRLASADSLGEIGDPRAIEPLMNTLNDTYYLVAEAASSSLDKIKTKNGIPNN